MTFAQLLARYEVGAVASHEFAVASLCLLDPRDPSAVLRDLPPESLRRAREFIDQYRPGAIFASQGGAIPSPAQVEAAQSWLDAAPVEKPRLTVV